MRKKRLPINRKRIHELPPDTTEPPTQDEIIAMARRPRFPKGPWALGKLKFEDGGSTRMYCLVGRTHGDNLRYLYGVSTVMHDTMYPPYREIDIMHPGDTCWSFLMMVRVKK